MAAGAVIDVLDVLDTRRAQLLLGDRAQVEHPPVGDALELGEGGKDLVADLVTALADTRADRGGLGIDPWSGRPDQVAGEAAPAAMQHRDSAVARQRDRQAIGGQDKRRDAVLPRGVAVDLQMPAARVEEGAVRIRSLP